MLNNFLSRLSDEQAHAEDELLDDDLVRLSCFDRQGYTLGFFEQLLLVLYFLSLQNLLEEQLVVAESLQEKQTNRLVCVESWPEYVDHDLLLQPPGHEAE